MTVNTLRLIFSRFRDLNLITLIEDLRRGQVAYRCWLDLDVLPAKLCPLAHGFCIFMQTGYRVTTTEKAVTALNFDLNFDFGLIESFVNWWDTERHSKTFLHVLESLWAERLADADAVQGVLEGVSVEACLA